MPPPPVLWRSRDGKCGHSRGDSSGPGTSRISTRLAHPSKEKCPAIVGWTPATAGQGQGGNAEFGVSRAWGKMPDALRLPPLESVKSTYESWALIVTDHRKGEALEPPSSPGLCGAEITRCSAPRPASPCNRAWGSTAQCWCARRSSQRGPPWPSPRR
jgi:hypothetical protein